MADYALYKDLAQSKALVTEKTGLTPSDLDTLLGITAGTDSADAVVYRPYYVAAKLLATRRTQLTQAEGASFVDPMAIAAEYLATQRSIDLALDLEVPSGAEALAKSLAPRVGGTGTASNVEAW